MGVRPKHSYLQQSAAVNICSVVFNQMQLLLSWGSTLNYTNMLAIPMFCIGSVYKYAVLFLFVGSKPKTGGKGGTLNKQVPFD